MVAARTSVHPSRGAALALGVALGGFFDGIVLHQVLQWHHLLSAFDGPGGLDARAQVMVDGLFHAAMYVLAAVALVRLLRSGPRPDGRRLAGGVLAGFGLWHALDAVLSHWLLGLHRIRMDTDVPLAWDLGWLVVFGVVPALVGLRLARSRHGAIPSDDRSAGRGPPLAWAALALLAGAVAARPAPLEAGARTVTVVLARDADAARMLSALPGDATIVASDPRGLVWQLRLSDDASPSRLLAHGAIWVSGSGGIPGCGGWIAPRTDALR